MFQPQRWGLATAGRPPSRPVVASLLARLHSSARPASDRPTSEAALSRQDEKPTLIDDVLLRLLSDGVTGGRPRPPTHILQSAVPTPFPHSDKGAVRNLPLSSKVTALHSIGMAMGLINTNPIIHEKKERLVRRAPEATDESVAEPIDQLEIFDHIRDIKDPEHPYSLEQLNVVTEDSIALNDESSHVRVNFTPTVEHCNMATIIGLCIRVKLVRSLPPHYKVDIRVAPGSHATEAAVNKKLNDKECVEA